MVTEEQALIKKFNDTVNEINMSVYDKRMAEFIKSLLEIFNQGLGCLKQKNYELAYIAFCVVVEGLAAKRYFTSEPYLTFEGWLSKNKNEVITPKWKFIFKPLFKQTVIQNIKDNYRMYNDKYGARKNFVKIIVETYREMNFIPRLLLTERIKKDGVMMATRRRVHLKPEEYYHLLEQRIKEIYDEHRSPFLHQAQPLRFDVRIESKIGGSSYSGTTPQTFGGIVLDVLKHQIQKEPFLKDPETAKPNNNPDIDWYDRIALGIMIMGAFLILFALGYFAFEWPVQSEPPYQKGLLIWGKPDASYAYPAWIGNLWTAGIVFFIAGGVLKNRNRFSDWLKKDFEKYLREFIPETIAIFSGALLILAIFSGGWKLTALIKFFLTSFILFLCAIYIKESKLWR